jgi:O-antigen/teichoic acid export membrane protein
MSREAFKSIARNSSVMLVQLLCTWASTFLLLLFLPRYLGPVEYGRLYLSITIAWIFGMLISYGGNYLVAKKVARAREETAQVAVDAVAFRMLFSIVAFVAMMVFAYVSDYPEEVRLLLFIMGLNFPLQAIWNVLYACYQGHELMRYPAYSQFVNLTTANILGVAALLLGGRAVTIAILSTLGGFGSFLVMAGNRRKIIPTIPRVNWGDTYQQLKEGFSYFMFAIFSAIYFRIDIVMLSKMVPEDVVGWYSGAYKLFESLNFVPSIYATAVYPVLSRLWMQEGDTHKRTTHKSLEFMVLTGLPISIAAFMFAPDVIPFFFGKGEYQQSIVLLQCLCVGTTLFYVDMVLGTTLISSDKQNQLMVVSLLTIGINIGLNYLMIPRFQEWYGNGAIGSSIATIVTEIVVSISMISLLPKGILRGFRGEVFLKGAAAGIVLIVFFIALAALDIPWVLRALLGPFVYVGAVLALRTLEPVEERYLREEAVPKIRQMFRMVVHGGRG